MCASNENKNIVQLTNKALHIYIFIYLFIYLFNLFIFIILK